MGELPGRSAHPGQTAVTASTISITPVTGSRLEQLLEQRDAASARAAEAAAQAKVITDAIKVMITEAHPGNESFEITGNAHRRALKLSFVRSWRLDAKRMKKENPRLYVEYAVQGGHWELREVTS